MNTLARLRARVLMAEAEALGLGVAEPAAVAVQRPPAPTLAQVIAATTGAFTPATAATYRSYWRLAIAMLGDRPIDAIGIADLQAVVDAAAARARNHRARSSGRSAREATISALRAVMGRAMAAGISTTNPAAALTKPRRAHSRRRALTDNELSDLIEVIRTLSPDLDLDLLLVRFHLETGARRHGALGLGLLDLDPTRSTVWLDEKDRPREQPVSPSLSDLLQRHVRARTPDRATGSVLRRRDGTPITGRTYDALFARSRSALPWTDRTPLSAHVLRHTAVTAVARIAGYPVAQAFAGHAAPTVTGRYIHATLATFGGPRRGRGRQCRSPPLNRPTTNRVPRSRGGPRARRRTCRRTAGSGRLRPAGHANPAPAQPVAWPWPGTASPPTTRRSGRCRPSSRPAAPR